MLLGIYEFMPDLLFSPPNPFLPGFLSFGWFRLVYMLRPGIWEEVAFRGVILNLQKKRLNAQKGSQIILMISR